MLEEQRGKIRLAEKSVRRPNFRLWKKWGHIRYYFRQKRFMYVGRGPGRNSDIDERLKWIAEWGLDNYPDLYEKEVLKCLELGLKPFKGLINNVIRL